MITCKVCGKENDEFRTTCTGCGSFVQQKVDALHLFSTLWGLIERPRHTFKRIVLAKHKNYAVVLSAAWGIALALDIAWYKKLGDAGFTVPLLIGFAMLLGPVLGIIVVHGIAGALRMITREMGGAAARRDLWAAVSFATMPMVFSLVFVVPIALAIFGNILFGTNPPPQFVRPLEYYAILSLKGLAWVWSVILTVQATLAANGFGREKLASVAMSVVGVVLAAGAIVHFVPVQWF